MTTTALTARLARPLAAAGTTAVAVLLSAGVASAGPAAGGTASSTAVTRPARTTTSVSVDLTTAKAKCVGDIDVRVAKLAVLSADLDAAKAVTDAHRSTQQASLAAASSGLTALTATIEADTDARTLKDDCKKVFTDFRVFALRAPQTGLVIAGDEQSAAVTRLNEAATKLADAIAKLEAAGKDVSGTKAPLADLQAKLADAGPKAAGIADSVIGFTAADHNTNPQVLQPAHTTALAVRADLVAARTDMKTIAAALKALK